MTTIDMRVLQEAAAAARRVIVQEYPDPDYHHLVIVLPVRRDVVRQAINGNVEADRALRRTLEAMVNTMAWPVET